VGSQRAGERVMKSVIGFLGKKLRLKVNRSKSAVAPVWERSFLGFSFSRHEMRLRMIARESLKRFKARIRQLTWRSRGRNFEQIVVETSRYLSGWRSYYGYSQDPMLFSSLDGWIRRKLRCLAWKQWKTGRKRYKELRKRGTPAKLAAQTAATRRGPWRMSIHPGVQKALSNKHLVSMGLFSLRDAG